MRILIYTHEYPPYNGGAGNYVYELAKELCRLNVDTVVIAPGYDDEGGIDTVGGPTVYRLRTWEMSPPYCYRVLLKAFLRQRPDMVLVADRDAQEMVARMPRRFFRYCVIVYGSEAWTFFDSQRSPFGPDDRRLLERFFLSAEAVLSISQATSDLFASYLPGVRPLVFVVGAGIDPSRFPRPPQEHVAELRKHLRIESENVILSLARICEDKGQDTLVRAFRRVLDKVPDAVLLVAGDGPQRDEVEELARQVGVFERTRFLGEVSDEMRCACYELCDVFAMPSRCVHRWEGFGLVFLEANMFAKPVVAGAAGGVPEAVEDGVNGLLVDPSDDCAVADAIVRLLSDHTLRETLGRQGRDRVAARFTSDNVARQTMRVVAEKIRPDSVNHSAARALHYRANLAYWIAYGGFVAVMARLRLLRSSFVFRALQRVLPAVLQRQLRRLLDLTMHGRRREQKTVEGTVSQAEEKCS